MKENPLLGLQALGQSIWMDFIRRGMLASGELERHIREDGLRGVTSNPSIFEKAIVGSHDYDGRIRTLAREGKTAAEIYLDLAVEDIQRAADLFRPVYEELAGGDGFVSLEVSPLLAHDTAGTIAEARRLWAAVDRPNVMIKVPGTPEGIPAIRQLIGEGINVNVTLLFGLPRYREVAEAFLAGLEILGGQGKSLKKIASVASFFLSRIDTMVDPLLQKAMKSGPKAEDARTFQGQVAIASAKVAYRIFQDLSKRERFQKLASQGARPQRLLWASTSTKNPAYNDVKYVEALIGPETINTLPMETLEAYRDHGRPVPRLTEDEPEAEKVLHRLSEFGVELDVVTQTLEDEGVKKFIQSFELLMQTLEQKRADALKGSVDRMSLNLGFLEQSFDWRLDDLEKYELSSRLWRKDPGLWKTDPEALKGIRNGLGWLHVPEKMEEQIEVLSDFVSEAGEAGFRHVLDLGMGGSSLAPLAFARTFPTGQSGLRLSVLDTTDPATVLGLERELPLADTLFIVASKSGTTAEPLAFGDYFFAKLKAIKGARAGGNFIAITDPGTPLVKLAQERGFRKTFLNFPDIGGRYSALSYFGLVPLALMGFGVEELLARSLRMAHSCASCVPLKENPGVSLGAALGELALKGRDKLTLLIPDSLSSLGMWLEQLLAESTGKENTGILPVANEALGDPSVYGNDRVFVLFKLKGSPDESLGRGVAVLQRAGHPVVTVQMDDLLDLGQELFRWEVATAVAGSILGINAFDQPNVQESKDNTNRLLDEVRRTGNLTEPAPTLREGPLQYYAEQPAVNAKELLKAFFALARPGSYIALQAYLTETPANEQALQGIRLRLRDSLHLATTLGFGPRFLHSTGQFHKGGPNTGLFLQLTAEDREDVPIPGAPYTFGTFKRAQALGDLEALRRHGRRILRIHLGDDVSGGLAVFKERIEAALGES
jgi:transaldolase/glucose-6-phosphate isomerase